MPDHRHGILTLVSFDRHDVPALSDTDDGAVRTTACRVNADNDRRRHVLVSRPFERFLDHRWRDELILACAWKLTVHLDLGLRRVCAVLLDDLVVDRFVRVFYCPGVDAACVPERPLGVEALKEVALVSARVAEREPVPVRRVLREEASPHLPDRVGYAAALVEDEHHPVLVVYARIAVRILR